MFVPNINSLLNIYFLLSLLKVDLELTSCGAVGSMGPSSDDCAKMYSPEVLKQIKVLNSAPYKGVQIWKVPHEGYYT